MGKKRHDLPAGNILMRRLITPLCLLMTLCLLPVNNVATASSVLSSELTHITQLYSEPIPITERRLAVGIGTVATLLALDEPLYSATKPVQDHLFQAAREFSFLVETPSLFALTCLLYKADPITTKLATRALVFTGLNTLILKSALGMSRPNVGPSSVFVGPCLDDDYAAMPSGHTAIAFTLATVLSDRYPKYRTMLYTAASLVGVSRVVLGKHWPSNVAAGAFLGVLWAKHVLEQNQSPALSPEQQR
ncbi:MAG: phosphatase PAP2 family protein [Limnochordia bacterium]|nr:phosphatase PAP2 family protein [Limnochordia bacterium]